MGKEQNLSELNNEHGNNENNILKVQVSFSASIFINIRTGVRNVAKSIASLFGMSKLE